MENSLPGHGSSQTPEYRLIKFLVGLVFISGIIISVVGLMLVGELRALSSSRESGFLEIKRELSEIKDNHTREVSEWTIWRNEVDRRILDLMHDRERAKEKVDP